MYIILIGGGRVGYYLARALLEQGHEVLIVERNAARCDTINDELGSICVMGDGCETATLTEVGTHRADMLIAVTGGDEDNLVACQVAKHRFGVRRTIARIGNPGNEKIFKRLGIDVTVSATNIILENIEAEVPTHALTHLLSIRDRGLEIVEVKVPPESTIVGKPIRGITLPPESVFCLIIRKGLKPIVPTPSTVIEVDDQIIAVTAPDSEESLRDILRGSQ